MVTWSGLSVIIADVSTVASRPRTQHSHARPPKIVSEEGHPTPGQASTGVKPQNKPLRRKAGGNAATIKQSSNNQASTAPTCNTPGG